MRQSGFLASMTEDEDHRREFADWPRDGASPGQFQLFNGLFGPVDAELMHCVVRHEKPTRVIEIGSGWSTLVIHDALMLNGMETARGASITTIDPEVNKGVERRADIRSINARCQDVDKDLYLTLEPGDLLSIDGSHQGGHGSDVEFYIHELLEMTPPGVLVHIHDIFLPDAYPQAFLDRGYDEQDHVAVFLNGHPEWVALFAAHWFAAHATDELKEVFPSYTGERGAGSLWITKEVV